MMKVAEKEIRTAWLWYQLPEINVCKL